MSRRWDAISASDGLSLSVGMKYRDQNRMGMGQPRKGQVGWQHAKTFVANQAPSFWPLDCDDSPPQGPQTLADEVDRALDRDLHPGVYVPDAALPAQGSRVPALPGHARPGGRDPPPEGGVPARHGRREPPRRVGGGGGG